MLAVHRNTFEKIHIVGAPLPEEGLVARNAASWAAQKWWEDNLHAKGTSSLNFPMIGRLVELLLRLNPPIRQALRSTYSHVFLDEFQDTTHVQYDLVKTAFLGSGAVLTAVGDNKQQIMRWAMALDDHFGCFEQDFGARRVPLVCNYRSSPELVRIQHHLAMAVDAAAVPAQSMVLPQCSENSCVILEFSTPDDEARYLAETIAPTITKDGLLPRDYAFLVKQRADDYESVLAPVFKEYGMKTRVEAELQDLLSERLTRILLSLLRLGSLHRGGRYWTASFQIGAAVRGLDPDDLAGGRKLRDDLGKFHGILRGLMRWPPDSVQELGGILRTVVHFLGRDNIRLCHPEYRQGKWFEEVLVSQRLLQGGTPGATQRWAARRFS